MEFASEPAIAIATGDASDGPVMAHFPAPAAAPRRTPCNIITGPLGAGKSSAIVNLLANHSDGNWAVLVNEIGDVGIDGAIAKSSGADGSAMVAEIAGGCICCANGVAATVTITRLLRRKPSRLLIEPSGLGHIDELAEVLCKAPLSNALELRGLICIIACDRHARLWEAGENYRDMVHASDVLVLNRRDVDEAKTVDVEHWARELYPPKAVRAGTRGVFAPDLLEVKRLEPLPDHDDCDEDENRAGSRSTWTHVDGVVRTVAARDGHAFVGLRWPQSSRPFDDAALAAACAATVALPGLERFKGVFYVKTRGWVLVQWVRGDTAGTSEPISRSADARLQTIFAGPPLPPAAVAALEQRFFAAQLTV